MTELCIRCNKPTPYHPNTPITLRRFFVEGSGQLCEKCFYEQYPIEGDAVAGEKCSTNCQRSTDEKIRIDGKGTLRQLQLLNLQRQIYRTHAYGNVM